MREKLAQLEENLRILSTWQRTLSPESVRKDKKIEWALRYGFFETIQILIDIACHIVSTQNLGKPKSYAECIEILEKEQYLDVEGRNFVTGSHAARFSQRARRLRPQID